MDHRRNNAQDVLRCHLCETPAPPMYCDICKLNLCKPCVGEHLSDESAEHKVVLFRKRGSTLYCSKHSTKLCHLHCEQCDVPICVQCISSDEHLGHKQNDILKFIKNKNEALQKDLKELENLIYPKYQEIASNISVQKSDLRKNSKKLKTALDKQGETLHREIDNAIKKLKTDVDELESKDLVVLDKQDYDIKRNISEITRIIADVKKLLDSNDASRFSSYKFSISKYRRIPPKVTVSSTSLSSQKISKKQIYQLFGSLSAVNVSQENYTSSFGSPPSASSVSSNIEERDAALDRLQEANQEIDRLQRELQNQKDSPQWRVEKQQAHRMQLEYLGTVTMLNKEIEVLQHDLQSTRDQLDMANTEVRELKRSNKDIEQQLIWKDQEIAVIFKEGMSDSRVGERKKIMDDTSQKLSSALKELDNVKTEKIALEVRVTELKKRRDELEKKEFDYVAQFRNAVQMVENSVIEKDQNQKDSPQWRVEEQQAHRMQLEYFETVTMLKKEIKALQNDLWSTRDQLDMANTEVRELKRSNKDIEQQLIWKDQELADVIFKEGMSDSREGELKKKMDDTSQK